jgi:hypothetical protein
VAGSCEPRIEAGEEPEAGETVVAGLADPVRGLPAGEQVAALDAGPASSASREPGKRRGAIMHVHPPSPCGPVGAFRHRTIFRRCGSPCSRQDSFPTPGRLVLR